MAANPDLQAAAERFVQARDMMMKARSQYLPRLGLGFGASENRDIRTMWSISFPGYFAIRHSTVHLGGIASWEPDFWSALRNATRIEIYRAEERAADYGLARLSLQAEIAANYFTLAAMTRRSRSIPNRSISINSRSTSSKAQFAGKIASALDVARVESLLFSTETKLAQIQGQRQVTEQAIAILVNMAPASFKIKPVDDLRVATFTIPRDHPLHVA